MRMCLCGTSLPGARGDAFWLMCDGIGPLSVLCRHDPTPFGMGVAPASCVSRLGLKWRRDSMCSNRTKAYVKYLRARIAACVAAPPAIRHA